MKPAEAGSHGLRGVTCGAVTIREMRIGVARADQSVIHSQWVDVRTCRFDPDLGRRDGLGVPNHLDLAPRFLVVVSEAITFPNRSVILMLPMFLRQSSVGVAREPHEPVGRWRVLNPIPACWRALRR
jgi:hypothetical protein